MGLTEEHQAKRGSEEGERMKSTHLMKKLLPLWIAGLILLVSSASSVFAQVSVGTTNSGVIGSELITITNTLTPSSQGIDVEAAALPAVGDTQHGAVVMTADGSTANTATSRAHYVYVYRLTVATADNGQEYSVELLKDGMPMGVLYVEQGADAAVGDSVMLTWDIGTSLSSAVFAVEVLEL